MEYVVTGGTGFIGRFLVGKLLERGGTVHVLVRAGSTPRYEQLRGRWPEAGERLQALRGDLTQPGLGIAAADLERLRGRIAHLFHCAAIYDIGADAASTASTPARAAARSVAS